MIRTNLPVILLKDLILFPLQEERIELVSDISKKAIDVSKNEHASEILIVCPVNPLEVSPEISDLPSVGVLSSFQTIVNLPNGNRRVFVNGVKRVRIESYIENNSDGVLRAVVEDIEDKEDELEKAAYKRKLVKEVEYYINKNPFVSNSIISKVKSSDSLSDITDIIGAYMNFSTSKKMNLMFDASSVSRAIKLIKEIREESELLEIESKIESEIQNSLEEENKKFIIRQKIKQYQEELGETHSKNEDVYEMKNKISSANLPPYIKEKLNHEVEKYIATSEMSPDAGIIRNYIDYLLNIPWGKETKDEEDIKKIEKRLNETHYGLIDAKERITEYIAVKTLSDRVATPIICLVGPPGVGKTTFAKTIATAVNREFVKISLGGMSDSAELIGHRRAYIGSNPGRIITSLIKCKSMNPVFLLDEVDKLKKDYKGDPASTLLDVLDVSQNQKFVDNYIDEEIDLSKVLFILTANDITKIPPALLDRLEIINLSGYSDTEKVYICENYVIPKILENYNLKSNNIKFETEAIVKIIEEYTSEAGVRELERCINKIIRKIITEHIKYDRKISNIKIKSKDIPYYLKKEIFKSSNLKPIEVPGVVRAVACDSQGGTSLDIECAKYKGTGQYTFTGSLGDVTKESIEVAISFIKANAKAFEVPEDYFKKYDLHIHFTESAIAKDGPSAGVAIVTAILSLIKETVIKETVTMTGEISLKGEILKVGGIKEKSVAAKRFGIKKMYVPENNDVDVNYLEQDLKNSINYVTVKTYFDIYKDLFNKK